MNIIKKELYEHVESMEKQIEINQNDIMLYQMKIDRLDEKNSKLMNEIAKILKKVKEME